MIEIPNLTDWIAQCSWLLLMIPALHILCSKRKPVDIGHLECEDEEATDVDGRFQNIPHHNMTSGQTDYQLGCLIKSVRKQRGEWNEDNSMRSYKLSRQRRKEIRAECRAAYCLYVHRLEFRASCAK